MDRMAVIRFLIEDTEKLRDHARRYREEEAKFNEWHEETMTFQAYNEARTMFPTYFRSNTPSKAKITANLKLIRRLSIEVQNEIENEIDGGM